MIYSSWRPETGGYDYYMSGERRGLGDDMPVPQIVGGTEIGVPSVEVGRRPPPGPVRKVGSGPFAKGSIMPVDRNGLRGVGALEAVPVWAYLLGGVGLGWILGVVYSKS